MVVVVAMLFIPVIVVVVVAMFFIPVVVVVVVAMFFIPVVVTTTTRARSMCKSMDVLRMELAHLN